MRNYKSTILMSILAVAVLVTLAVRMGGAYEEQAEAMALNEAGFSKVTSVEAAFWTSCRKGTTGYKVKGVRGEKQDEIVVCATGGWGAYIID